MTQKVPGSMTTGVVQQTGDETIAGNKTFSGLVSLTSGQLKFPATQVPSADANTLDDYEEGTFDGTLTGCTTTPTITFRYVKIGGMVTISHNTPASLGGTSNATTKTITGVPAALRPSVSTNLGYWTAQDNGGAFDVATVNLSTAGEHTLGKGAAGGVWTNLGIFFVVPSAFTYPL